MQNKKLKIVIKFVSIGAILLQFYQPARNIDNGQTSTIIHFTKIYNAPQSVQSILQNSCYDCHSNNTNYRWYDYIQPARTLVESHIKNAKNELNFSEWGNYSNRKQQTKIDRIIKQIKTKQMPLMSYILLHQNAILNETDKKTLIDFLTTYTIKK
jgi:hypothetical protein